MPLINSKRRKFKFPSVQCMHFFPFFPATIKASRVACTQPSQDPYKKEREVTDDMLEDDTVWASDMSNDSDNDEVIKAKQFKPVKDPKNWTKSKPPEPAKAKPKPKPKPKTPG